MNHLPYFSIVIPVFNRPEAIVRAVQSCLGQSFEDFEVIVVDDGSDTPMDQALQGITDDRLVYKRLEENQGVSVARNVGMDLAKGRYIAFLDSDDIFEVEKLKVYHDSLVEQGSPNNVCYSSPLYFKRESGMRLQVPTRLYQTGESVLHYIFVTGGVMSTDTLVVSSDVARNTRFRKDLKRHEDYDFCWRLEKAGVEFKMLPETLSTCIDYEDPERLTHSTGFDHSSYWINSIVEEIPSDVHSAFQLRVLAPLASSENRFKGLSLYFKYVFRANSMSMKSRLVCLIKCMSPYGYRKLTTTYVAWKGAVSPV